MTPSDPEAPAPAPPPAPSSEEDRREAFWTYSDLFLFVGLSLPAMFAGLGLVRGAIGLFRLHPTAPAQAIAEQLAEYFFLFLVLVMIFRVQYGRPFWLSLGWRPLRWPVLQIVLTGWAVAILVNIVGYLIHTRDTNNPLMELMETRVGLILVTIFGVTLGPLAEELAFRGFFQPLLVRSMGAIPGIVLTALPFGLLHFREYGNSWRHVILITGAGAAFGWVRHATGSTKASTLMHAAYNLLFFAALWGVRQGR